MIAQITDAGETSQNNPQPSPSVTTPNTAMNTQARITGIDSTTRSIRNANTRRVSTPRNSSGYSHGSKGGGPLVELLVDMISPFDCVAAQDMEMVRLVCKSVGWA